MVNNVTQKSSGKFKRLVPLLVVSLPILYFLVKEDLWIEAIFVLFMLPIVEELIWYIIKGKRKK